MMSIEAEATQSRDRILAEERLNQAVRSLREVLSMSHAVADLCGGRLKLLEVIHQLEAMAYGVAEAPPLPTTVDGVRAAERWLEENPVEMQGSSGPVMVPIPEPFGDRLAWDVATSTTSPVVRGTWVTAAHVVSLVVDGWTWRDILRAHPELAFYDIRTCLEFTAAMEPTAS